MMTMPLTRAFAVTVGICTVTLLGAAPVAAEVKYSGDDRLTHLLPKDSPGHLKQDLLPGSRPFDGHGPGWYSILPGYTDIQVRQGYRTCHQYPSSGNCWAVVDRVSHPESIYLVCQQRGEQIEINPYWVYVNTTRGYEGYMASFFIDNRTNWIEFVPEC